jgi:hypothetical protein
VIYKVKYIIFPSVIYPNLIYTQGVSSESPERMIFIRGGALQGACVLQFSSSGHDSHGFALPEKEDGTGEGHARPSPVPSSFSGDLLAGRAQGKSVSPTTHPPDYSLLLRQTSPSGNARALLHQ